MADRARVDLVIARSVLSRNGSAGTVRGSTVRAGADAPQTGAPGAPTFVAAPAIATSTGHAPARTPIYQCVPAEGPCDAPDRYHSGTGFLWNEFQERACGEHQNWLARVRSVARGAA